MQETRVRHGTERHPFMGQATGTGEAPPHVAGVACVTGLARVVECTASWVMSGYHADTPITIKAEPSIWPTAAFINIHEHPL